MLTKKTKIGILAPVTWSIPPKGYAPYSRDVDLEIKGLLAAGYSDITLFATKQSQGEYPVKVVYLIDQPFGESPLPDAHSWEIMHIVNALDYANKNLDLLHSHLNFYPVAMSKFLTIPMVTTLHSNGIQENERAVFLANKILPYFSISFAVRKFLPELNWVETVYNGVDFKLFPLGLRPGEYLVYAGRIIKEKGVDQAIALARKLKIPLKIAGFVQPQAQEYFRSKVKPYIDGERVEYFSNLSPEKIPALMAGAMAYLALNQNLEEPFGNSVAEAMASGTPVIATYGGAHDELVKDKITGILVKDIIEAEKRFDEIKKIDRGKCRETVEKIYDLPVVIKALLRGFKKILG